MISLPELLFNRDRQILEGTNFYVFCEVNRISSNLTIEWTRNQVPILPDLPHIRTDRYTSPDARTTLLLVIDYFGESHAGVYQCIAQDRNDSVAGKELNLTGTPVLVR